MARPTPALRRSIGPNAAAAAMASRNKTTANIIWPVLRSRAAVSGLCGVCTISSLPEPVDPVVVVSGRVNDRVVAELCLAERQADLVGIRRITTPGNDPFNMISRRIPQRGQPLAIAALVDQLIRWNLKGNVLVSERLHEHQAAGVARLEERDDWLLLEYCRGRQGFSCRRVCNHVVVPYHAGTKSDREGQHQTARDIHSQPEPLQRPHQVANEGGCWHEHYQPEPYVVEVVADLQDVQRPLASVQGHDEEWHDYKQR